MYNNIYKQSTSYFDSDVLLIYVACFTPSMCTLDMKKNSKKNDSFFVKDR